MADNEALLKEFETVRSQYVRLVKTLVQNKVPGAIDLVASTCDHGTVCHGGGGKARPADLVTQPQIRR